MTYAAGSRVNSQALTCRRGRPLCECLAALRRMSFRCSHPVPGNICGGEETDSKVQYRPLVSIRPKFGTLGRLFGAPESRVLDAIPTAGSSASCPHHLKEFEDPSRTSGEYRQRTALGHCRCCVDRCSTVGFCKFPRRYVLDSKHTTQNEGTHTSGWCRCLGLVQGESH